MKIAIIGGIGSGKSEALHAVKEMGYATLSADELNSQLLCDGGYISLVKKHFPSAVKGGKIERATLASIVFSSDEKRETLNKLAHPLILKKIAEDTRTPLFVEMPLFVEIDTMGIFDKVILITANEDCKLARLKGRGLEKEDALSRMAAQASDEERQKVGGITVSNDGDIETFREKVKKAVLEILA